MSCNKKGKIYIRDVEGARTAFSELPGDINSHVQLASAPTATHKQPPVVLRKSKQCVFSIWQFINLIYWLSSLLIL